MYLCLFSENVSEKNLAERAKIYNWFLLESNQCCTRRLAANSTARCKVFFCPFLSRSILLALETDEFEQWTFKLWIVRTRQFIVINNLDNIVRLNVSCSNTPLLQERRIEIVCAQILIQMYSYQKSRTSRTKTSRISIRIVRTLVVLKN